MWCRFVFAFKNTFYALEILNLLNRPRLRMVRKIICLAISQLWVITVIYSYGIIVYANLYTGALKAVYSIVIGIIDWTTERVVCRYSENIVFYCIRLIRSVFKI